MRTAFIVVSAVIYTLVSVASFCTFQRTNECRSPNEQTFVVVDAAIATLWPLVAAWAGLSVVMTGSAGVLTCNSQQAVPYNKHSAKE